MKKARIVDGLYLATYNLFVCDKAKIKRIVKNRFNIDLDNSNVSGSFYSIRSNSTGAENLIVWIEKYDLEALVHELCHAVMYILSKRGVKITSENDEAFCYYMSWLVGRAVSLLRS